MAARGSVGGALAATMALVIGCGAPRLPPGWTESESIAFMRQHEREIGDPLGPLAAVASYYVDPGQTLALGVVDGALTRAPAGPGPRLRLAATDDGARCLEGCGPTAQAIEGTREVVLDRFTLRISPQSGATRVLVHDPQAPALAAHEGLRWFDVDPRFIVAARFEADPERPTVELSTSRGVAKPFVRAGVLRADLRGHPIALVAYQAAGDDGSLLVPFTDQTTGDTTYPVGRYLQVEPPVSGSAVLDFNRATNPWCAYSEHYNCPVPPAENRVALAVEAGEQIYAAH